MGSPPAMNHRRCPVGSITSEALVDARTKLGNWARGLTKSFGERLPSCDTDRVSVELLVDLPPSLQAALQPLMTVVQSLTEQIHIYDQKIAQIARSEYPETARLRQVTGVGELIALSYVLTLDDPQRFRRSRDVGGFLGLPPERKDSRDSRPPLRITNGGPPLFLKLVAQTTTD